MPSLTPRRPILNGIIAMDKINKEHKRVGRGLNECWKLIIAHIQRIIEVDGLFDDLSVGSTFNNSNSDMNQLIE